ncbi:MAG: anion transporter [Alphaproteobacteria bacterium]|nr:anion transporter [Alphaproteobacteria bacterium]
MLSPLNTVSAYVIFGACYLVFAAGKFPGIKIDRPGAAIIGATLMVATGILAPQEALRYVDCSTLVLLFSMMLIVASLHLAGFFEWIAHLVVTRLKPRHLLPTVIFTSGLLSAFLVNDIVCLAMVPLVLAATRRMNLKPLPYLLAVATASNIGSVATITGNPQNILIGSYSGIPYVKFMCALGPVAVIGLFIDWAVIHYMRVKWGGAAVPAAMLDPARPVNRKRLLKPAIILTAVLAGFLLNIPPALAAATGAAALLVSRTHNPRAVYEEIDWGLLIFFTGLFLIVGGAEKAGLDAWLLDVARHWNLHRPEIFTVAVALLSNVISNVPAVMLVKPWAAGFAHPQTGWLFLAMASTLAGNLTITGSVANIIVIEQARKEEKIGFLDYLCVGLPVTVLTLLVGVLWLEMAG